MVETKSIESQIMLICKNLNEKTVPKIISCYLKAFFRKENFDKWVEATLSEDSIKLILIRWRVMIRKKIESLIRELVLKKYEKSETRNYSSVYVANFQENCSNNAISMWDPEYG